jgi:hypothetical protein
MSREGLFSRRQRPLVRGRYVSIRWLVRGLRHTLRHSRGPGRVGPSRSVGGRPDWPCLLAQRPLARGHPRAPAWPLRTEGYGTLCGTPLRGSALPGASDGVCGLPHLIPARELRSCAGVDLPTAGCPRTAVDPVCCVSRPRTVRGTGVYSGPRKAVPTRGTDRPTAGDPVPPPMQRQPRVCGCPRTGARVACRRGCVCGRAAARAFPPGGQGCRV